MSFSVLNGMEPDGRSRRKTMAGILDSLSSMLTPDTLEKLGNAADIDPATLDKGIRVAAPTLLGCVAKTSSTRDGAASLQKMLLQDTGGDVFVYLTSSITGGAGGTQADLLIGILGPGPNGIAGTLS